MCIRDSHTGKHHHQVRPIYLHGTSSPTSLQGCAKIFDNKEPGKGSTGVTNDSRLIQTGDWYPFISQKVFTLKDRNQRYLSKESQLSQPHNSPTSASHNSPHDSPHESAHDSPYDSAHDSPHAHHTIVSNEWHPIVALIIHVNTKFNSSSIHVSYFLAYLHELITITIISVQID